MLSRRKLIVERVRAVGNYLEASARSGGLVRRGSGVDATIQDQVRALTKNALDLFEVGEEGVAWWTQVELYAAFAEAASKLEDGRSLLNADGSLQFTNVRVEMLEAWALGTSDGPRFRGQEWSSSAPVDRMREAFVTPFSEAPDAMLWAPILDWRLASGISKQ